MQSISAPPLEECPKCKEEGRLQWVCDGCAAVAYSVKDVEIPICSTPNCQGKLSSQPVKPKKLISLSSFQLVGGGWARDLYSK